MICTESDAVMKRNKTVGMTAHDLAELHGYLLLFSRVYDDMENEVMELIMTVREKLARDINATNASEIDAVIKMLRNPRGAGRKSKILPEEQEKVMHLYKDGNSIRKISEKTHIPKSTVQRIISNSK